ncbi:FAD-binding oxidoreductase [Amycolatopsis sp. YIM 10]|uniref:NAD(P)/FAD-dependent oxidoreductase n=1 Tax=Amycolatopsis sp. YIM 10 TaxID=2653857 RepID=UPI001290825A|nr:FAD-binding oxidoreductase [Amycolatopsis sp. YIM 10]QFU86429.1 4-methylaminobutanoate oxidase (formaldehyde-forming) [Amycolatopsis sp. YIM 10]
MANLPERAGVVIVGGGVIGVSCAFQLAEAGVDVLLLERGALGAGSTAKAAGGVRSSFTSRVNIELGLRGLAEFERFPARFGQEIDFRRDGYLYLITDPADLPRFERGVALQNSLGVASRVIEPAEAVRHNPLISVDGVHAAVWSPEDGRATPDAVVQGYARAARALGATLCTGVEVVGIDRGDEQIRAVQTSRGVVRTEVVLCAAGAWSARIGELAGCPLPVSPERRQVVFTGSIPGRPESVPLTVEMPSAFYLHPEGDGLALSLPGGPGDAGFDSRYEPGEWLPALAEAAMRRAPSVLDAGIRTAWAGLYEMTPDRNQVVGEAAGVSRFLYATGFSGHGFQMGPAVGAVMRDLYLGREPEIDVSSLDVRRFDGGVTTRAEYNIV